MASRPGLWDVASHQPLATLNNQTGAVQSVAFSPDGQTLATGNQDDTTVRLWNLNEDQATNRICHIIGTVNPTQWAQLIPELPYRPTCP